MRYLNFAGLVVLAGAAATFACGDGDTLPDTTPSAGNAGTSGAHAGSGGHAGAAKAGAGGIFGEGGSIEEGGEAGTNTAGTTSGGTAGTAGEGGTAGTVGGTSAGGTSGYAGTAGTAVGGTAGIGGGGGTSTAGTGGAGTGGLGGLGGLGGTAGAAGHGGSAPILASLTVTVNGVPIGATASVAISGPNSYAQTISATSTLTNLEAGAYTVAAPPIRVPGTQVDAVYDSTVTGSPASVTSDAASAASVSYAPQPGTGLWATNAFTGRNAFGFDATAIAKTGVQTDAATKTLNLSVGSNGAATQAIAFATGGALWASSCKSGQVPQAVAKYGPSKLTTGAPASDVKITLPATDNTYDCASALAFDSAGNLWVGLYRGHILKYNAADLTANGTPTPAVILTSTYFNGLVDLAFDSAGNLVVCAYYATSISRLSVAQLATSNNAIVPAVLLAISGTGVGPGGITFGSDGSLWVADYNQGGNKSSILKFNASSLGTSGTPTPDLVLKGIDGPEQLVFDKAGNLWVASYDSGNVVALAASDLTTGGTKTPLTTLTADGAFSAPYALRFNPGAP